MKSHILFQLANRGDSWVSMDFPHETLTQPLMVPQGQRNVIPGNPTLVSIIEMMEMMNPLRIPVISIPDGAIEVPGFSNEIESKEVWKGRQFGGNFLAEWSVPIKAEPLSVSTGWKRQMTVNSVLEFLFRHDMAEKFIMAINSRIYAEILGENHPDNRKFHGGNRELTRNMLHNLIVEIPNAVVVVDKNGYRPVLDMLDESIPLILSHQLPVKEDEITLLIGNFSRSVLCLQTRGLEISLNNGGLSPSGYDDAPPYWASIEIGVGFRNRDIIHAHNLSVCKYM